MLYRDSGNRLNAQVLIDGRVPLTINDRPELVFSHSSSTYWILLKLHNPGVRQEHWLLQLNYAPLDHIQFTVRSGTGGARTVDMGDRLAFNERPVPYRYYLLPLQFEAGGYQDVVIRIHTQGAISVPLSLYRPGALINQVAGLSLGQGLFYGGFHPGAVQCASFLTTRRREYFYNAFYMLSAGVLLSAMGGLAYQFLWPNSPWLANTAIPLSEAMTTLAFMGFANHFLEIRPRPFRASAC